jgi:hypothetical protein
MLIHFAFGSLGKAGKIEEQTKKVIELIFLEKKLLVSKNKEFIPAYPRKSEKLLPTKMFKVTGKGEASVTFHPKEDPTWYEKLPDDTRIHYLPVDIPMICFIKIAFTQLKNSTHCNEYGKFGLVFTNDFLKKKGVKPVFYYTEESLWNDELIRRWNSGGLSKTRKVELEREIVSYRKPATLFSTFKESVTMKMTTYTNCLKLEYLTYDRYNDNYDFRKENEYRITFEKDTDLYFEEKDLFIVIVPNVKAKGEVESFFRNSWSESPNVELYPS